jgi:hypothetical protein
MQRVMFKGGTIRVIGTVRGCEPEVAEACGWPYPRPWMFEVRDADRNVIAVCFDHETANQVLSDMIGVAVMSGASERTLHVRARYYPGGKKGRSAARRLRAMGLTPGYTRDGWRVLRRPVVIESGEPIGILEREYDDGR